MSRFRPNRQWLRHAVQSSVVVFMVTTAFLAWYGTSLSRRQLHQDAQKVTRPVPRALASAADRVFLGKAVEVEGDTDALVTRTLDRLQIIQGNPWAASVMDIKLIDPLAGVESQVARRGFSRTAMLAMIIPVGFTVLLGRVFCSWICPAGFLFETADTVRRRLGRAGTRPRETRLPRWVKYGLLGMGLVVSALVAAPVLGAFYPPALFARELNRAVFAFMGSAGSEGISTGVVAVTGVTLFLAGIVAVETTLSRRIWCRYLCPGGALYAALGSRRLVRVQRSLAACTDCASCSPACGMGLNPMRDLTGAECDNCMECITSCPDGALTLTLGTRDRGPLPAAAPAAPAAASAGRDA